MDTIQQLIDGVTLIAVRGRELPHIPLGEFPPCCGAGRGLQEWLVPDTIWGLRISAACQVHDDMFELGDASWDGFHQANGVFIRNIFAIIEAKSSNAFMRAVRRHRALLYLDAVDTMGAKIYWNLKKKQGYSGGH